MCAGRGGAGRGGREEVLRRGGMGCGRWVLEGAGLWGCGACGGSAAVVGSETKSTIGRGVGIGTWESGVEKWQKRLKILSCPMGIPAKCIFSCFLRTGFLQAQTELIL